MTNSIKVTGGRKLADLLHEGDERDLNTSQDYARLQHMGNPAQELALRGADCTEALKVPEKPLVPGARGNLTEMPAEEFLRKGFPNMSRKDRRKILAKMKARERKGLPVFG